MLLPMIGSTLAVIGNYNRDPMKLKVISIAANGLYLIYGIMISSVAVIIGDSVLLISAFVGIVREFIRRARERKAEKGAEAGSESDEDRRRDPAQTRSDY